MCIKLNRFLAPLFLITAFFAFSHSFAIEKVVTDDLNLYFSDLDQSFARIVDAGALRSTRLKQAEHLFVREMRRNRAFSTFIRTNSKGMVISEVIRGEKVERPMRDISDQQWFKSVSSKKEAYYSLIKDPDRGRYYLFWARPILKQGDRYIGSVLLTIDLWDSFYEFSNNIYFPFLIKLGKMSLFSHKWQKISTGKEEQLTIQGINKITVTYIPETKKTEPVVAPVEDTTQSNAALAAVDTTKEIKAETQKKKRSGLTTFFIIALLLIIVIASGILISWMRKRALLRRIDDDDNLL